MNDVVVGDSDGLIALASKNDSNHKRAVAAAIVWAKEGKKIFFPNTVIVETITTLKRAKNLPDKAHLINKQYLTGAFNIIYVDEKIQKRASELFEMANSKKNTLFDALVASSAEHLGTKIIFSFDEWYEKLGFELASDK